MFENLKKRFSKRRIALKNVQRSGTSTSAVTAAKERLYEFKFMAWLLPHIQTRSTVSNLPARNCSQFCMQESPAVHSEVCETCDEEVGYDNHSADEELEEDDISIGNAEKTSNDGSMATIVRSKKPVKRISPGDLEISAVTGKTKWKKKIDRETAEMEFLKSVQKVIEEPKAQEKSKPEDTNYHFAMMVCSELSKFSPRNQCIK